MPFGVTRVKKLALLVAATMIAVAGCSGDDDAISISMRLGSRARLRMER